MSTARIFLILEKEVNFVYNTALWRSGILNEGEGLTLQHLHRLAPKFALFPCGHTIPSTLHTNLQLPKADIFQLLRQFRGIRSKARGLQSGSVYRLRLLGHLCGERQRHGQLLGNLLFHALEYHLQLWPRPPKKKTAGLDLRRQKPPVMMTSWFLTGWEETDCGKEPPPRAQRRDLRSHQQWESGKWFYITGQAPNEGKQQVWNKHREVLLWMVYNHTTEIIVQARSIARHKKEWHESGRKHPWGAVEHAGTSEKKSLEPRITGTQRGLTGKEPLNACSGSPIIPKYPLLCKYYTQLRTTYLQFKSELVMNFRWKQKRPLQSS